MATVFSRRIFCWLKFGKLHVEYLSYIFSIQIIIVLHGTCEILVLRDKAHKFQTLLSLEASSVAVTRPCPLGVDVQPHSRWPSTHQSLFLKKCFHDSRTSLSFPAFLPNIFANLRLVSAALWLSRNNQQYSIALILKTKKDFFFSQLILLEVPSIAFDSQAFRRLEYFPVKFRLLLARNSKVIQSKVHRIRLWQPKINFNESFHLKQTELRKHWCSCCWSPKHTEINKKKSALYLSR